jgi:hypothetical protein
MRAVTIEQADLVKELEDDMILLGDAAYREPNLSGNGANGAIIDGVQLADAVAKGGREDVAAWYESQIGDWKNGTGNSEQVIAAMHGEQRLSLRQKSESDKPCLICVIDLTNPNNLCTQCVISQRKWK